MCYKQHHTSCHTHMHPTQSTATPLKRRENKRKTNPTHTQHITTTRRLPPQSREKNTHKKQIAHPILQPRNNQCEHYECTDEAGASFRSSTPPGPPGSATAAAAPLASRGADRTSGSDDGSDAHSSCSPPANSAATLLTSGSVASSNSEKTPDAALSANSSQSWPRVRPCRTF